MELANIGINHQTAPLEVREQFSISKNDLGARSQELLSITGISEGLVLSTCNRTEYYVAAEKADEAIAGITECFQQLSSGILVPEKHLYSKSKADTARHLFKVCSGLDSMVLGETEIFGQVKDAYRQAHELGITSKGLNKLFQKAFAVGKKVRTLTRIQNGNTSTGSVAVDLAQKIFGNLKDSQVLLIGAGEISRVTAQSLKSRGAHSIHVANRSFDKAVKMAEEFGGLALHFDAWEDILLQTDVIISSTGAPHYVISPEQIERVRAKRKYRPLFLMDLAVPRDIDPACRDIEEVYLYDVDSLESHAARNMEERQKEIIRCEEIIEEEILKAQLPGI